MWPKPPLGYWTGVTENGSRQLQESCLLKVPRGHELNDVSPNAYVMALTSRPSESLCSGGKAFKDGIKSKQSHWGEILRRDQDIDKHREGHVGTGREEGYVSKPKKKILGCLLCDTLPWTCSFMPVHAVTE